MLSTPTPPRHRIFFISSCITAWGGSEELWGAAALTLAGNGHAVTVFKHLVRNTDPHIRALRAAGCRIVDIDRSLLPVPPRLARLVSAFSGHLSLLRSLASISIRLRLGSPDLVVVSQGNNFDGWRYIDLCRRMKVRYLVIAQKASELYWPLDRHAGAIRAGYQAAERVFFVSEHNLHLTEDQIGAGLPQAEVVRNPFLVKWDQVESWPDDVHGIRLASVGRLYPTEKGQDLLLRVLARTKWKQRPLTVTLYGEGPQRKSLESLAARLGLASVSFAGHVDDIDAIWKTDHGLVLPSRCEGMSLALVETMLSSRVAIVTDVAGSRELIEDGVSGFLADAPTEDALDEAMERAWNRRQEWREIGRHASRRIRTLVPRDPGSVFASRIEALAAERKGRTSAPVAATVRQ